MAIELLVRQTAEVANTRQGGGQQTVEEFPHAVATQGDASANGLAFAQLEVSDGLAGSTDFRLLSGNGGEVFHSTIDALGIMSGGANTHVDDNLGETRDLHDVLVSEFLLESVLDLGLVAGLQTGGKGIGHD